MKKLFSLMLAILTVFTLSACADDTTITVEIELENGETTTYEVNFEPETELNLLELIEEDITVGYTTSEYGAFIYSIDELYSQFGNYISFSKNGEMSMVGIEAAEFADGDTFTFSIVWYDATAEAVYNAIDLFIENQIDTYINEDTIDYNVVAALNLLGATEDYLTAEEVATFYTDMELTTINDYFKKVIIYKAVGLDTSDFKQAVIDNFATGPYGQTAYASFAVQNIDADYFEGNLETTVLEYHIANPAFELGLDAGAVSLLNMASLGVVKEDTDVAGYFTWISDSIMETGGVKTRDMVYGDTTYPGTENASSMAQVILAMVAYDENPTGEDYTVEGKNLVTRLTEFQTETGAFNYLIEDENADLMFSTPQAFLALVSYYVYSNTMAAQNPYIIELLVD